MPEALMKTDPTATATFILDWSLLYRYLHPRMKNCYKYHRSDDPRLARALEILEKYAGYRADQVKVRLLPRQPQNPCKRITPTLSQI